MRKETIKIGGAFIRVMLLLAVLPASVLAYSATARVDRTRISLGETLQLQVIVDGGDGEVDISAIKDFQIVSTGTQSSRSYINGTWKHEVSYVYHLTPQKTGTLKIPALDVKGDDETVQTQAIKILCEKVPEMSAADAGSGFQARAEVDAAAAVPGQQVVYTLRLLSPKRFGGAEFSAPDFRGLDARALTKWRNYTKTENGLALVVNEIKYVLQAKDSGTYDIGPAVFTVQEPVAGGRRRGSDPFDSLFNDPLFNQVQTRPVRVVSNPITLEVSPLPTYKGDGAFSGLIGAFTVAASLDKDRIRAGESVTLSVVVQGQGNVMDIGTLMPRIDDAAAKVYPDTPEEEVSPTEKGLEGKKIFRTAVVPKQPGKLEIPSVSLTFYDPGDGSYKTMATRPLTLEVLPGEKDALGTGQDGAGTAAAPVGKNAGAAAVAKADVTLKNRDILDIREDLSSLTSEARMSLPWFVLWLVLPGLGFGFFLLVLGQRRRQPDKKTRARKKASDLLRKAAAAGPGDPGFLQALRNGLIALMFARAGREGENLTCSEAKDLLEDSGVAGEEAACMVEMMEALDQARFGGKPMDEATAEKCLKQIRTWAKTLVLVMMVTVSLSFAPPAARASVSATQFVDAVRAYKAGQFEQAANAFEAIAAEGVENPALFYNTANAWLRDNNLGRAILWYERALRLSPSDPDIRFNLSHARSLVKDRVDHPITARDILFFWKGMVSLKTLQLAAIAGSCLFFIWAAARVMLRKRVVTGPGVAILTLFILVTAAAFLEEVRLGSDARAVILSPAVQVRSGTQGSATALFDLHAGTTVKVLEKKGDHIKIGIAGGKVGWISLADAERI